jgi:hypothetical protein
MYFMNRDREHISQDTPSDSQGPSSHPGNYSEQQLDNREGTIHKAEDTASRASSFDDDFEVQQEDEMNREEAKTEDENS